MAKEDLTDAELGFIDMLFREYVEAKRRQGKSTFVTLKIKRTIMSKLKSGRGRHGL